MLKRHVRVQPLATNASAANTFTDRQSFVDARSGKLFAPPGITPTRIARLAL